MDLPMQMIMMGEFICQKWVKLGYIVSQGFQMADPMKTNLVARCKLHREAEPAS